VDFRLLVFWSCVGLIAYTYAVYPAILVVCHRLRGARPRVAPSTDLPPVTLVVPVFNEEAVLPEKLANLEGTEYPAGRFEAIVGSDGSTDGTNAILSRSTAAGVRSVIFPQRRGKAALLNDLVALSAGDIVVFSDANAYYEPDTVRRLVEPFADPDVGAVCGELILRADRNTAGGRGEGLYWKYENALKRMESDLGTTLGAVGPVYAIRKRLFRRLPAGTPVVDDFVIPLSIIEQGYRVLYEPSALAYEKPSNSVYGEFQRKTRIGAQNFQGIPLFRALLNPAYGFASFALWSHKIVRWIVPLLMIGGFAASLALAPGSSFFMAVTAVELAFFAAAIMGLALEATGRRAGVFGLPYYFVATNAALLVGLCRCLFGRQQATWDVVR
jgi:cellulose synthase/poly-beta-1,6-N-acetylglucosamine synthase-like glycosyltransferase